MKHIQIKLGGNKYIKSIHLDKFKWSLYSKIIWSREKGVYNARIYREGSGDGLRRKTSSPGGLSTMYPDTWNSNQMKAVATSAYLKFKDSCRTSIPLEEIPGSKYKGISIKVEMGGKTPSIYPVL